MKKILFIYCNPLDGSYGGSQGSRKALAGLKENFNVVEYSCLKKNNKLKTFIRHIFGYAAGLSAKDCSNIVSLISSESFDAVFFDVSVHGILVRKLKKIFPNLKVIVNYHNCEEKYYKDWYKTKGFVYYPIYRAAVKNEKLSKVFADFHVFISEEDRKDVGINSNYTIIPVVLDDCFDSVNIKKNNCKKKYILFVGAAQFANIEGAKYIINKIAPKVSAHFIICGKGMTSVFNNVKCYNVEILDFVPNLADMYRDASAVICPLFYGSGAKVKVAEALMYGKKILGTPLSFYGYKMDGVEHDVCLNEHDFIEKISKLDMEVLFYKQNRQAFIDNYSSINNGRYYSVLNKIFD